MSNSVSSNQPWSIDDLIENAPNWNLAGDANLLKYLESFSEDLLVKASKTNDNLNSLLDSLNSTSLSLDLVKNEFSSLHNKQFIESRVYEDDETIDAKEEQSDSVKASKQTESENAQTVQEAVMRGIEVVNKYFDKVDVPDSDSEEETDFPSFVLRPKDPYIDRPLPFVIGTDEWHSKWHVGLLDSSSESETEKVSDKYSDSDSDDDLPIKDRTHTENSYNAGSDVDLSSRLTLNRPVANSTFEDSVKRRDIFESSDSEEYENSVPAQTPISNNTFAQELAAKLGNVIEQNPKIVKPEVNTKPIQPIKPTSTYGNIFAEEPPPLDDEDEEDGLFGNSNEHDGLFSGRGALFDDLNDDLSNSWSKTSKTSEQSSKPKPSNLFDDEGTDIFNNEASGFSTSKKSSGGLFDEDDAGYSDNDLFTDKPVISTKPLLQPYGPPTIPYFDDKPPEFEPVKSKKPIGGVKVLDVGDLFGNQTIGSILKSRKPPSLSDDSTDGEESPIRTNFMDEKVSTNETVAKVSVNKSPEQKEERKIEETKNKIEENVTTKINPKQISLFDDDDEDDVDELFKDDLFSDISTKKFTSNLFDDDDILKSEDVFSESFKSTNNLDSVNSPVSEVLNVTNETKEETASSAVVDEIIFDQPPMDDDWDTASEHNLFEPSSIFSESSGIIRDSNTTRIETDDSFNPNICSSRRFSYDNYNEEQSNDSLFNKNKPSLESQSGQYITSIPEVPEEASSNSIIDITPSGNPDNLYSELEITKPADENANSKNLDNNLFEPNKPVTPTRVLENNPEIFEKKETPKVAPKPTVAKKPNSEVTKNDTNPKELKIGNPGKLKHNLNINVSALMPGVAPPRKKEVQTPTSPNVTSETGGDDLFQVKSPTNLITSDELDFSRKDLEPTKNERDPDLPEVLPSITKDRAKIAVKRRPSTRKARQESIRNSMTDFKLYLSPTEIPDVKDSVENKQNVSSDVSVESPKESVVVPTNSSESSQKSSVMPTNPSEVKFDELFGDDDLFTNTSSIEDDLFGKNIKVDTSSLFDDSLESNTSLFDEKVSDTKVEEKVKTTAPSTTTVKQTTPSSVTKASSSSTKTSDVKKVSLFDDSEEFDDIFSTAKLPSKTTTLKKSLFDDDDDDDLFGPIGASQKLDTKSKNKVSEKKKVAPVKKLENTKVVDDPLSFFND